MIENTRYSSIVLGSSSPRRKQLISSLSIPFRVISINFEKITMKMIRRHREVKRHKIIMKVHECNLRPGNIFLNRH